MTQGTRHEIDTTPLARPGTSDATDVEATPSQPALQHQLIRAPRAAAVASISAPYRRRRGGGAGGDDQSRGSSGKKGLLSDAELDELESRYPEGVTAVQVVELFSARDVRFSEASFRKYVQLGLLPRSRRVGRKGKHRGSLGMYPTKTVRRVNEIKRLMAEGYTIEEIQAQFMRFTNLLESLEEDLSELFSHLTEASEGARFDNRARRSFKRELTEAREAADELLARLDGLTRRASAPQADTYRSAGAAGSAEDLL
ncbi:MerR family transcriptional regulator [Haliangium sp.]|uniref:MerR family transcriptional regulator n=1 Tax=Haliangium sp. TaxID=2663208 RepID=UPI003D107495